MMKTTFKCVYSFREIRNYQSQQESIYMSLINRTFDIVFISHKKPGLVTIPFFRILKLVNDNETIPFKEVVERRIAERLTVEIEEGSTTKTANRRCENYRLVDTLHLLNDILEIQGYTFDHHLSTGKKGTLKAESIYGVYDLSGNYLFNQESIAEIGTELSAYIAQLSDENGVCTLRRNDPFIQHILNGLLSQSQQY